MKKLERIVYKNNILPFEELLELDKSFKIHHRNIQLLAIYGGSWPPVSLYITISNFSVYNFIFFILYIN